MRQSAIVLAAVLHAGFSVARPCGGDTSNPTYRWAISDFSFDGPDPTKPNNPGAVAGTYLIPNTSQTLYSCMVGWPEAWGGYAEGGSNLIWGECTWTGPGRNTDDIVSFAMDWKNRTAHMAHIFSCDDAPGSMKIATGSVAVDLECSRSDAESRERCFTKVDRVNIETRQEPATLAASASCTDNAKRLQSWRVVNFTREYDQPAATAEMGALSVAAVSGPAFSLHNLANGNVFSCTAGPDGVEGTCKLPSESTTTTAKFRFNANLGILSITQSWTCGDGAAPFEVTGVVNIQDLCDRDGNTFRCASNPFWIGSKIR